MDIVVSEGGELLRDFLNAVAAFTGDSIFDSLLRLGIMAGLLGLALHVIHRQNIQTIMSWLFYIMIFIGVAVVPKTTVIIQDKSNPGMAGGVVANVPIGLAFITSASTKIGNTLAETYETLLSSPTAVHYTQGGLMWGHKVIDELPEIKITDAVVRENTENFIAECIFPVLITDPAKFGETRASSKLWTYMGTLVTSGRSMVYVNDTGTHALKTCDVAYNELGPELQDAVQDGLGYYGKVMFPDMDAASAKSQLEGDISTVHNTFIGVSESGANVTLQLFLINATTGAATRYSTTAGDSSIMNMVNAQATSQSAITMGSIGNLMQSAVPKMYTLLLCLLVVIFPLVAAMMVFPSYGASVLKSYMYSFLYIQFFPLLFVIFNGVIQNETIQRAQAITEPIYGSGTKGLSIDTLQAFHNIPNQTAAMAAVFLSLVPVLAGIFTKGVTAIGGSMESVLRPYHTAAEGASAAAATGNISLGNANIGNQNFNNVHGNQKVTSGLNDHGAETTRLGTGVMSRRNPDGSTYVDSRSSTSNLLLSSTASKAAQSGYRTEIQNARADQQAVSSELSNVRSKESANALSYLSARENGQTFTDTHGVEDAKLSQSTITAGQQWVSDFAKRHNVSYEDALALAGKADLGLSVGVGGKKGPAQAGANFGIGGEARATATGRRGRSEDLAETMREEFAQSQVFQDMQREFDGQTLTRSAGERSSFMDNWSDSRSQREALAEQQRQAFSREKRASEGLSYAQSAGSAHNLALDQAIADDIMRDYGQERGLEILSITSPSGQNADEFAIQQDYADRASSRAVQDFVYGSPLSSGHYSLESVQPSQGLGQSFDMDYAGLKSSGVQMNARVNADLGHFTEGAPAWATEQGIAMLDKSGSLHGAAMIGQDGQIYSIRDVQAGEMPVIEGRRSSREIWANTGNKDNMTTGEWATGWLMNDFYQADAVENMKQVMSDPKSDIALMTNPVTMPIGVSRSINRLTQDGPSEPYVRPDIPEPDNRFTTGVRQGESAFKNTRGALVH